MTGEITVRAHRRKGARYGVRAHLRVLDTGNFGVLSASRSDLTPEDNHRRSKDMLHDLILQNYQPVPAYGTYRYADGRKARLESYMVPCLREEDAVALGRKYQQEAVLVDNRLVSPDTNETITQFNPEHTLYGDEATRQDFSTQFIDGPTGKRVTFSLRE